MPTSTSSVSNVRLTCEAAPVFTAANPRVSGTFSGGMWSGNVAVPFAAAGVRLRADDGASATGQSNAFAVQGAAAVPGGSTTVFSEDFETPALGSWWTITGTNNYRTMSATGNTPHGGLRHLVMDASVSGAFSRNEATLTVDLAGRTGVSLSFWAKEFTDEAHGPPPAPFTGGADFDGVAISADGTTWYEVQALRTLTASYAQFTVNLDAAIAAYGLSYNSSFRIRFNQYDDFPAASDGIAIDDIAITAAQTPGVTVAVPAQAAESAGVLSGTVTFPSARGTDTAVALSSNASARAAVPASVIVAAGQSSASFPITVLDNAVADGNRNVGIVATPPGSVTSGASMLVIDDDGGTLVLTAPASATEGAAALTGMLTLSAPVSAPVTFTLVSSDTTEITVPATVTVAAGQASATFLITVINDTLLDGAQTATITASATGWSGASTDVTVLDNDLATLAVSLPASTIEGASALSGTVTLGGALATPLTVSLSSSDTTEVTVPATVTVAAGATTATFLATVVNDTLTDGAQNATITASASGFPDATASVTVADNDVHHFAVSAVASPQARSVPFTFTATAKDVNDVTITTYITSTSLSGTVSVTPAALTGWTSGVWMGLATPAAAGTGVVLTVSDGNGHTGTSNAFDVVTQDYHFVENWPTFGNGPAHTGYQPVTLGATSYVAGWTKSFPATAYGLNQVAVSNGKIYVTPYQYYADTYLSALDGSTGAELWRKTFASSYSINPPTVNAGKVYTQRETPAELLCTDAISGAALWTASYTTQGYRHYAPTVVNDGVWVNGGTYGGLYGFNTSNGSQRFFNSSLEQYDQWTPSYSNGTVYSWVAGVFRAHDSQTGAILWSSTLSTGTPYSMNTVAVIDGGRAFVVGSTNCYAIDLTTHATAWTATGTFKGTPAVANGIVYVMSGSDVKAYNATTGALAGTYATGSTAIYGQPIVTDDSLIVASGTNTYLFSLGASTPRQTLANGGAASLANDILYLAGTDGVLRTFRPPGMTTIAATVPASASEGSAPVSGTVTLSQAQGTSTVVSLASGNPSRVTVPASVMIPAGQTSASFAITIVDDALLNGSASVDITAKGPTPLFLADAAAIAVSDNETAALAVSVPPSATEGATGVTGTVTVSSAPVVDLRVNLASSDATQAVVPSSVTVLAGQTSATFAITIVDDLFIDGAKPVTITASVAGWTDASAGMTVLDDESPAFSFAAGSVTEGSPTTGYIYIDGTLPSTLTITLTSADPSQFTVPASVTIPAGSSSAGFAMTAVDDTLTDGTKAVVLTASAPGFTTGTTTVSVYDNDLHHFTFGTITGTKIVGQAFSVTAYARTIDERSVSNYSGTLSLSAIAGGSTLSSGPASVSFSSGAWSGSVTVNSVATGVTLKLDDTVHTGTSSAFDVGTGALSTLVWSAVPASVSPYSPFNATITARDTYGNTVAGFNGTAALTCGATTSTTIGTGTSTWDYPMHTGYHDSRTQVIYLASEMGGARQITALSLYVASAPAQTMNAWTIRMQHTAQADYATSAQWQGSGWATVYQANQVIGITGWVTFVFSTPFSYDGTSNLMVDFSHNNSSYSSSGYIRATPAAAARALYYYTDSGWGDPLTWSGTAVPSSTSIYVPNVRLITATQAVGVIPAVASFVNGVWSGALSLTGTGAGLVLTASASGIASDSNAFNSSAAAAIGVSPSTVLTTNGTRGGPFTPLTRTLTVSNGGSGSMTWSAGDNAAWLDVSPGSGVLAAGANTTVTATLDAAALAALPSGSYDATLLFTNVTSGVGNTVRTVRVTAAPFGELAISPAGGASVSGPFGGPFETRDFTLTNSGDAPLDWTAGKTAPWLVLSSSSGTLAPGASTVVTASFDAAVLNPGAYADTITFTNATNGAGTATRAVALAIELPAPVLAAEPAITPATTNTIAWSVVQGANGYEVQIADGAAFASPASGGWSAATSHTFSGLSDGVQYFYRARARRYFAEQVVSWMQTTQGDFDADAKISVATTPEGGAVLATRIGAEITGRITNASFESSLAGWTSETSGSMGANSGTSAAPMPTQGARYANVFTTHNLPVGAGNFSRLRQSVDLTGVGSLVFDAMLAKTSSGSWAGVIRGEVRIDGITVWSATAPGVYLDQAIDVSYLPGVHEIELRDEVVIAGTYASQWVLFDNLRTHEPADGAYRAAGSLVSTTIAPAGRQRWGALNFARDTTVAGTTLSVDVLDAGGALLASDLAPGVDLGALPAIASQPSIRLRANFSTTDSAATPRLDEWSVAYVTAAEQNHVSAWSGVESSTQFNAPPTIAAIAGQTIPEDGATGLLSFTVGDDTTPPGLLAVTVASSNPALIPAENVQLGGAGADRSVRLAPVANANGSAVITLRVTDEGGKFSETALAVVVVPVNDAPTFVKGADVQVNEDAGARTIAGWATAMSAGPADEAAQALDFLVSDDNAALFAVAPAIAANGALTFTAAPDANGSATVTVRLHDDGGTADGGTDTSAAQTFTITIAPVNDAPTLAPIVDVTILEDAGEQTVALTGIGAGAANEAQALTVTAFSSDGALIAAPVVTYTSPDATGTLRFAPRANAVGTARITVTVEDSEGGVVTRSFAVNVNGANDAPTFVKGADVQVNEDAGARTIAGWATAMSAGPADEAAQALDFLVSDDNAALFAVAPAIAANGALTFTAAPDANGSATVTVRLHDDGGTANGGADTSAAQTFKITIAPVNDAPRFVKGADVRMNEDAGAQTIAGWATAMSAGPADESGQVLDFLVSNDNAALFAVAPAIAANGTLTFTPAPDANGSATVTVRLHDDGGTADRGTDTSAAQTFTIATSLVNDAPSFVKGADIETPQDAGPQSFPAWATQISAGPADESGQALDFVVSVDRPELFAALPAIMPGGTLSYTPASAASGTAIVTVRLHDDGGTAEGGSDTSAAQTFTIAVTTFEEELGAYTGLVTAAPGTARSADRTGLITVKLTRGGKFTGKLKLGRSAFALKGDFDRAGVAHFAPAAARRSVTPPEIALKLDVARGSDSLAGTIMPGSGEALDIRANRAPYTARRNPLPPLANVPAALLGAYTVLVQAPSPGAIAPEGSGAATLTVPKSGIVRLTGTLADGTKLACANPLAKSGAWPLYQASAAGRAVAGWAAFRDQPGASDLDADELLWFCPPAASRIYPDGWPGGVEVRLAGAKYQPPAPGSTIFPALAPGGSAMLTLSGAGMASPIEQMLGIDQRQRATPAAPNANGVALTFTAKTGLFGGKFTPPGAAKPAKFGGAILQKAGRGAGAFHTGADDGGVTLAPR